MDLFILFIQSDLKHSTIILQHKGIACVWCYQFSTLFAKIWVLFYQWHQTGYVTGFMNMFLLSPSRHWSDDWSERGLSAFVNMTSQG